MAHHEVEISQERFEFTSKMKRGVLAVLGLGVVLSAVGMVMLNGGDHDIMMTRFWTSVLLGAYYTTLLALGGTVFIAIGYATNAGWSVAFKRVPEAMGQFLIIGVAALLVTFFLGKSYIYEWSHDDIVKNDTLLQGKNSFLNVTFVTVASIIFFGLYYFFTKKFRSLSLLEDNVSPEEFEKAKLFHRCRKAAAGFLALFGFTFPVVSWMWMMSIDPHWFSTIFSVYNFAVMWVCAITTIALIVLYLKRHGHFKMVSEQHMHDLGKMMFAFSIFWTYIWISQYLLIWYANIPEESIYYTNRAWSDHYIWSFWLNLILNFVCPLLLFMASTSKKNPKMMAFTGAIILIGHWNDIWLMITPGTLGDNSSMGLPEIGFTLIFFAAFIYTTFASLAKHNLVPVGHPYIKESALHEVHP